jgi:uncharacterized phage-like protein YoqJ
MIVAATGHRPKSLPTGYNITPLIALVKPWLTSRKPDAVISGMALGWDQAVAQAAIELGIQVHAYVPFVGQADAWPSAAHAAYQVLMSKCAKIRIVSPGGYEVWKMQKRNEAMVDDCDLVLALWNGEAGGTGNCVRYAGKKGKTVENLWEIYDLDL